jgi:hypothetical protein
MQSRRGALAQKLYLDVCIAQTVSLTWRFGQAGVAAIRLDPRRRGEPAPS